MATPYSGRYVVFEGGEATGKSILSARLKQRLEVEKVDVELVREPGGTPFGEKIRHLLLDPDVDRFSAETERDLFMIARRELGRLIIRPFMENGGWVISDRSWISSLAYQGFGRELGPKSIIERAKEAMGDLVIPDEVYIIDIDPQTSIDRLRDQDSENDRLDDEDIAFKQRLREGYLWLAGEYGFVVIDGLQTVDSIDEIIWERESQHLLAA